MEFRKGDRVKIIQAEQGAWGVNGEIGIIASRLSTSRHGCGNGIKVLVNGKVWQIGKNPKLKLIKEKKMLRKIEIKVSGTPENTEIALTGLLESAEYKELQSVMRRLPKDRLMRVAQAVHGAMYDVIKGY